ALEQGGAAGRVGAVAPGAEGPPLPAEIPHPGEDRLRVLGIQRDHRAPGGGVSALEHFLPRLSAVRRLVDAALVAVAPELSGDARVHGVRLGWVDQDLGDALGLR